jgi:hypothetical protein
MSSIEVITADHQHDGPTMVYTIAGNFETNIFVITLLVFAFTHFTFLL